MSDMVIELTGGISAELVLMPMPKKDAHGQYPRYIGEDAQPQPDIFLTFRKEGRIIAPKVPWGLVISGEDSFTLAPNITLGEDDLSVIDSQGWDMMLEFGMYPTEFVG